VVVYVPRVRFHTPFPVDIAPFVILVLPALATAVTGLFDLWGPNHCDAQNKLRVSSPNTFWARVCIPRSGVARRCGRHMAGRLKVLPEFGGVVAVSGRELVLALNGRRFAGPRSTLSTLGPFDLNTLDLSFPRLPRSF